MYPVMLSTVNQVYSKNESGPINGSYFCKKINTINGIKNLKSCFEKEASWSW